VLVGITDTSFAESVNIAEHSADAGAQAVVLAPPYYFPANQPELMEYVEHIAAELPLPVFLYNMPSHTKVTFGIETLRRALDISNVVGLKDSSGQMVYFHEVQQLVKDRPDFTLLVGPEQLLAETVLLGGHGGVSGGANLLPRLYVDLYNAASAGDLVKARQLHGRVMEISTTLYAVGKYGSAFIKGLKCALSCLGICDDVLAEPFQRFAPAERRRVEECLASLEISAPSRARI
jgi:4-hydroxy-tetrahydrodipicolinate synthase